MDDEAPRDLPPFHQIIPSDDDGNILAQSDAEWLDRMIPGQDPKDSINVVCRWNSETMACEIAVDDPSKEPDLEEWSRWAKGKDLYIKEIGTDDEGRRWMSVEGPGARDLFDTIASEATEMATAQDYEEGKATLAGALMSSAVGRPINKAALVAATPNDRLRGPMPEWEGSPSYRQVWESTDWCHNSFHRAKVVSSMDVVGADAKIGLRNAHPIVIPPEQVAALPTISFREAIEYIAQAHLPFPQVFIDAADSPDARDLLRLGTNSGEIGMVGGVVADLEKDQMRGVVPCGAVLWPQADWDEGVDGQKPPPGYPGLLSDPAQNGLPSHAPIATCLIAPYLANREKGITFRIHEYGESEPLERLWTCQPNNEGLECIVIGGEVIEEGTENAVIIPAVADLFSFQRYTLEEAREKLEGWAKMAAYEIRTLASVLMFLDSHNVELIDQPLSRQVRRQAERKNKSISKTVYIRHKHARDQRDYDYDPNAERQVGLDHQYEVMGHIRHFTRGSHVECRACKGAKVLEGPLLPDGSHEERECDRCNGSGFDPEKEVTPCARRDEKTGELTCPGGCRKEWVPTFVKGNPDAPLVMKLRKQM